MGLTFIIFTLICKIKEITIQTKWRHMWEKEDNNLITFHYLFIQQKWPPFSKNLNLNVPKIMWLMRGNAVLSSLILFCKGTTIQKEIKAKWKFLWDKQNRYLVLNWAFQVFHNKRHIYSRRWNGSINVISKFIVKVLLCQKFDLWQYSYEACYLHWKDMLQVSPSMLN